MQVPSPLNHTEEHAAGVLQDDEITVRAIAPRVPTSAELHQPRHFAILIVRIEIQMQPTAAQAGRVSRLKRHVGALAIWVPKDHPTVTRRLPWNVMERVLPKGHRAIKRVAMHDDGTNADAQSRPLRISSRETVPPNESRLSCGALNKDSFLNLRAPPASSAC